MVFNWFKRKFSNQDESTEQEPLTEDVVADDTDNASTVEEGDTSDDSDDSSAEDYLAWAQAAFDNLNEGSDSSESTEEVTVQDETEHPIDVAPKTASDQSSAPSEIEESAAIADTTSTLEPEEIESPDTEEVVKAKIESEHEPELEVEPTAEPAPKSVSEPAQAPEIKPAPTLNTATRSTDMDEGFRWSAEVLAAQGRKVEEVSAEEITWLKKLRTGLGKTRRGLVNQLKSVVGKGPLSDDAIEEIETLLLQADVGIQATDIIVESLQSKLKEDSLPADEAIAYLKSLLRNMLDSPYENGYQENFAPSKQTLNIWLMAGVNGVGKTTTIGKLTNIATTSGYRCLIAAADTFRAAAVQQVKVWGERSQVDVICNPFSGPNKSNGQAKLLNDSECDTAFRCAVEFGQDDSGQLCRFGKDLCLPQPVLAECCIQDE